MDTICNGCGKTFTAARSDARYCSARCRVAAHRDRQEPDRPRRSRPPLPDSFTRAKHDAARKIESMRRLTEDDRFARNRNELQQRYGSDVERMLNDLQLVRDRLNGEP